MPELKELRVEFKIKTTLCHSSSRPRTLHNKQESEPVSCSLRQPAGRAARDSNFNSKPAKKTNCISNINFEKSRFPLLLSTKFTISQPSSVELLLGECFQILQNSSSVSSTEFPIQSFVKFRHVLFWELRFSVSFRPRRPPHTTP